MGIVLILVIEFAVCRADKGETLKASYIHIVNPVKGTA